MPIYPSAEKELLENIGTRTMYLPCNSLVKKWQVFEPSVPLPLSHQTSAKFPLPPQTDPIFECTLTAGDLLYIPRGWWHDVTPLDTDSLHLSIGTYPPSVRDYLLWICSTQLPASIAARKACPTQIEDLSLQMALEQLIAFAKEQEKIDAFNESQRAMAQHKTEFQSAIMLKKNALTDGHLISLNSFLTHLQNIHTISFKDKTLNTNSHGRRLINLLRIHSQLSWGDVKQYLADIPAEPLYQTTVDLSRFELLNIHTPL